MENENTYTPPKKSWTIEEQFVGWGHATVWAETAEEAKRLYEQGEYDDYEHDFDNFQDYEFVEIEEVNPAFYTK